MITGILTSLKKKENFKGVLTNIFYFSISVVIFFVGVVVYGIILNIREVTLPEAMSAKNISEFGEIKLVVDRSRYRLILYSDQEIIKEYKAVFGKNPGRFKKSFDDNITPNGSFHICSIDTSKEFYKLLKLNFPTVSAAAEALKDGILTRADYTKIYDAERKGDCPPNTTILGANIAIQGMGEFNFFFKNLPFSFNWTNGSIAISNEDIDELAGLVKIGTNVEVIN